MWYLKVIMGTDLKMAFHKEDFKQYSVFSFFKMYSCFDNE